MKGKKESYYMPPYSFILICFIILLHFSTLLEDEEHTTKCTDSDCKKSDTNKQAIRKKVIKKLKYPTYIDRSSSIKSKIEDIQTIQAEEPSQIYIQKINNVFSFAKKTMWGKGGRRILSFPQLPEDIETLLVLSANNERSRERAGDIVAAVKFQKVKHNILQYLTEVKYSIDSFWYLVKKLLIDDNSIFAILKLGNPLLCEIDQDTTADKIFEFSGKINYSPLGKSDKSGYYIENSISSANCEYLKRHFITDKNSVCTNLAILNLFGYCRINNIAEKVSKCLGSSAEFTSSNCKDFKDLLSELNSLNKSYITSANHILQKQVLPAYFSIKLIPRLEAGISNQNVFYHLVYTNILQEWLDNLSKVKEKILSLKKEYSREIEGQQCAKRPAVLDYLDKIIEDVDTYHTLVHNIENIKAENVGLYMNKLPVLFSKLILITTLPTKWGKELAEYVKENIDISNVACIFRTIKSILNELYISSNYFVDIKLEDLVYPLENPYKIYALVSNISEDDFSLKNLLSRENTYGKLKEFVTFDYRLSLLYILYDMKKCTGARYNFEKFLEGLNYSKEEGGILECLIRNKGAIRDCNTDGVFDILINFLSNLNMSNFSIGSLSAMAGKISEFSSESKITGVIKEYNSCCEKKCSIPTYCDNRAIIEFCKECFNTQSAERCNDIQDVIRKCCFGGKIQQVISPEESQKYDPCKLGFKSDTEGVYRWEYPEFRCSLGSDEQKKCYKLLLSNMGKLQTILKYLLEDKEGKFDSGKTFCSNPLEKLNNLCCNSIVLCSICQRFDKKLCRTNIANLFKSRQLYEDNLKDVSSKSFLELLRKKVEGYSKNGFSFSSVCVEKK